MDGVYTLRLCLWNIIVADTGGAPLGNHRIK